MNAGTVFLGLAVAVVIGAVTVVTRNSGFRNRPKRGDRYRSRVTRAVEGVVTFNAPISGGFQGKLPAGEELEVDTDPPTWATGVYLRPLRYAHFEAEFVSPRDRANPDYDSYSIAVSYEELQRDFEALNGS